MLSSTPIVKKSQQLQLPEGVECTETGLIFHREVTADEWKLMGITLKRMSKSLGWWIGDWLAYGDRLVGLTDEDRETAKRSLLRVQYGSLQEMGQEMGVSPQHLSDLKNVALRVNFTSRLVNLTTGHAIEILRGSPDAQFDFWAHKAVSDKLSTKALRGQLRMAQRTEKEWTQAEARQYFTDMRDILDDFAARGFLTLKKGPSVPIGS
jgi:hypothetical protein